MSANAPSNKTEHIDLRTLTLEQLMQIKQEFEQEVNEISESLQTLYNCKAKYAGSKEALEAFQPDWEDKEVLVPLTSSMYVPGKVKDINTFTIDVGTGYYLEKNLEDSKDYFRRRVDYVQEQIEKVEKIQLQKRRFLSAVVGIMETKQAALIKQMQQQQQAAN